ncbi:MAG: radical SAM protein [Phycisphaeraceae bacterium]|nr:radical SAM protein [Phycisphaeraceae bacterium]
MTTLNLNVNASLARTVAYTGKLKSQPSRFKLYAWMAITIDFVARAVFYLWRNRRYLSVRKLANMALINVQFYFKTQRVIGMPYKMKIESTNICNTKCQLCPTGIGLQGRPKGSMTFQDYQSLINQVKGTLHSLDLSMWGDPLIVPDIYKMIQYAHDNSIWTYISSNLHAFKPGKGQAESLVNSGLDLMTCSLHGATQETYECYQPGKTLEDSVEKIRHIITTRNAMESATPQVQLNFVVTKKNEHEQEAFQLLADELGCKAVFSTPSLNIRFKDKDQNLQPLGLAPDILEKKIKDHLQEWLPEDKNFALPQYQDLMEDKPVRGEEFNGKKTMNCDWPWRMSVINWDGEVSTCCGSFEQADDMGNVLEHGFKKIWNGPKYQASRRSFKHKLSAEQSKDNPCATCPGFML